MVIKSLLLKDLLTLTKDGEWGKGEPDDGLVEMSVIRGTDFESVRFGDISTVPVRYIPEQIAARKQLQPGDILLETAGGTKDQPTGRTVFLRERLFRLQKRPFTCASFSRFLRVDHTLAEPEYVFWYLKYLYHTGDMYLYHVQHTGVARFQYTDFASKTRIPLPPRPEQRAIARILGALDDKIELNRQMNATLEALARALFQSWFIDFDPVRAKAAGHAPHGMDATTAALFPDGFEDSELGIVPQGWQALPVNDLFEVAIGKTPPRNEHQWFSTSQNDIPWMSIRDLGNSNAFIARTSEFLTSEAVEKFRVKRIPNGTVVLSFKLTVGRVAITDGEMLSNEAIAHFRPRSRTGTASEYLYCYLKQFRFDSLGSTSSIATAVNSDSVRSIPILVPSDDIIRLFSSITTSYFQKIKLLQRESYTIAALRDTLLPRLLAGELRVGEAEQMVTEVV